MGLFGSCGGGLAGSPGLAWSDVRPRIEAAFASLPDVRVLLFEPKGAPEPATMPNRTKRPNMTPGRALLLTLMNRYVATGYDYRLSLLEIQKLAYFLQEAGEALRLKYAPHLYGPYADNLRHVLNHIEGHFTVGFGDGQSAPETPIRLLPEAPEKAEAFLAQNREAQARLDRVAALIEGFETPFGMELLATVHWVMRHDESKGSDPEAVIAAVHRWNSRKAATMKPTQIRIARDRLQEQGWV